MQRTSIAVAILLVALAAGCDQDDAGADAGPLDSGHVVEAGTGADAGGREDAGREDDAGSWDAGLRDGGGAADAGPADASADASAADGGTDVDGGAEEDAGAEPSGETCATAIDVTAGGTFTDTTVGAGDDYSAAGAGCPTGGLASGPDRAYFVRPSAPTSYRVTVMPTSATFDPMLVAVTDCAAPGCVAGTRLNGPGVMEQITFDVAADQTVFVVVDGENFSSCPYTLTVAIE
jgi:hypothetical protein